MVPCMQMKALRTRLVVSYNLVPYTTYVTRSTRYLRERTSLFPRHLDTSTGEVRYEGGFGHADYCNFVNFYF